MTQKKYNATILNLLLNNYSQILTMRDFLLAFLSKQRGSDRQMMIQIYNETVKNYRAKTTLAVKEDLGGFDVDDLLKDIL